MTETPTAVWKDLAEAYKARCEFLEAEVERLKAQGDTSSASNPLTDDLEAVIVRYSMGNAGTATQLRTYARTQIAAGGRVDAIAREIARGGYDPEGDA